MGVANSKLFVNRMLRSGLYDANDDVVRSDAMSFDTPVNCFEESLYNKHVNDDDVDNDTNLLLSLLVHHLNVRNVKKQKGVQQQKLAALKTRRHKGPALPRPVKKIRVPRRLFFNDPTTGVRRPVTPKLSLWWLLYLQDPQPQCKHWSKSFRQRFRLPYDEFCKLLVMMRDSSNDTYFQRWMMDETEDGCHSVRQKRKSSPMELLLLGSLRYLGRGWTFDDLAESTFVSRDVHRCFFHKFCAWGAKVLYPMYVRLPTTQNDLRACEQEYSNAGFPGCIGSTDATHIPLEKVSYNLRQGHLGYKMSTTARTYNLTVNHRRQILHSTTGHPGRWNDKTLVRFDSFMTDLHNGAFNDTMSFKLKTNTDGETTTRIIKGAYVIVDNGYLKWSTTVPPIKHSCNRSEIRFSQWLESLRKDVECTFGILKGRWRVLKSGIRVHNTEAADNIWLTCCALHNILLDVDGLSVGWDSGVPSSWEGEIGNSEPDAIPAAIRRLISPDVIRTYDQSSVGYRAGTSTCDGVRNDGNNGNDGRQCNQMIVAEGEEVPVNQLSLHQFRAMLIEHFNISFHENRITWPKRLASKAPPRHVPNC